MSDRDVGYAIDILLACQDIAFFLQGKNRNDLENNEMLQAAVLRKLEVIGEVAKRLSDAFKTRHAVIPWKNWAGLRDRLIHGYDDVNLDIVWDTVAEAVPALALELKQYESKNV